jgi:hypothetical protein
VSEEPSACQRQGTIGSGLGLEGSAVCRRFTAFSVNKAVQNGTLAVERGGECSKACVAPAALRYLPLDASQLAL